MGKRPGNMRKYAYDEIRYMNFIVVTRNFNIINAVGQQNNFFSLLMDYVRDGEIKGQLAYKKTKERRCISPSLT